MNVCKANTLYKTCPNPWYVSSSEWCWNPTHGHMASRIGSGKRMILVATQRFSPSPSQDDGFEGFSDWHIIQLLISWSVHVNTYVPNWRPGMVQWHLWSKLLGGPGPPCWWSSGHHWPQFFTINGDTKPQHVSIAKSRLSHDIVACKVTSVACVSAGKFAAQCWWAICFFWHEPLLSDTAPVENWIEPDPSVYGWRFCSPFVFFLAKRYRNVLFSSISSFNFWPWSFG